MSRSQPGPFNKVEFLKNKNYVFRKFEVAVSPGRLIRLRQLEELQNWIKE